MHGRQVPHGFRAAAQFNRQTPGKDPMLFEILFAFATASTAAPAAAPELTAQSTQEVGATLVARLTEICSRHPEVERAFVFARTAPDGQKVYTFIPIFDRKVADVVLDEADAVYKEVLPTGRGLEIMLLARSTWKRTVADAQPIYVRPRK
jgi:hypothetical protein